MLAVSAFAADHDSSWTVDYNFFEDSRLYMSIGNDSTVYCGTSGGYVGYYSSGSRFSTHWLRMLKLDSIIGPGVYIDTTWGEDIFCPYIWDSVEIRLTLSQAFYFAAADSFALTFGRVQRAARICDSISNKYYDWENLGTWTGGGGRGSGDCYNQTLLDEDSHNNQRLMLHYGTYNNTYEYFFIDTTYMNFITQPDSQDYNYGIIITYTTIYGDGESRMDIATVEHGTSAYRPQLYVEAHWSDPIEPEQDNPTMGPHERGIHDRSIHGD